MVRIEGVMFTDKSRVFVDKEVLNSKPKSTCLCEKFFNLQDENERLRTKLATFIKVYEKDQEYKEMQKEIRLLREKVLVLERQNRVYASILEKGEKNDKRA